jgi:hypothetical protein
LGRSPSRGGGVYEGEFFENQLQGWGAFHFRKMKYEGNWKLDRRENDGRLDWPNDDFFKGKWVHGARKGKGVFVLAAMGEEFEQVRQITLCFFLLLVNR